MGNKGTGKGPYVHECFDLDNNGTALKDVINNMLKGVRRADIDAWKESKGEEVDLSGAKLATGTLRFVSNVLWVITFGWILALSHCFAALANLLCCVFIVTIPICLPNMMANFKLIPVALRPFGVKILPNSLAEEIINARHAKSL